MTPDANDLCVFAIKRGYIENREIYCNPLYPFYLSLIDRYKNSPFASGVMRDYVYVNPKTDCSSLQDDDEVSFIPMPNVHEKNNSVHYDLVKYSTVKKGFTVFQRGDLIWAKITPCMQNGKSCLVDDMPTNVGFGSTEFHVIRKRNESVYMPYLWAIFASENVLKAAQATFSGTAGQQRVSASFIENFPAVIPDYSLQVKLVSQLEHSLGLMNEKTKQASVLIDSFKKWVTDKYALQTGHMNRLCVAIKYIQLDGVIDAKRYMAGIKKSTVCIADICEIIEDKTNVSKFGNNIVNWIRIDDLQNRPLEIDIIRTVSADSMEGSFFEVKENDILVARLGPTILNQKIVKVPKIGVTTLASAEFLVLRCKKGVNPDAVMSILRTDYYRDLMYSHARGSTPSRYRLNREDALALPFPDIRKTQEEVALEAINTYNKAKELRSTAIKEWAEAKAHFEKELLGET